MLLIEPEYLILILRKSEKIIFLLQMFEWLIRMITTLPFYEVTFFLECFASDTIESLIHSLIDISSII